MQDLSEYITVSPLTPAEQAMVQAIADGETASVGDEPVRASVIRDLAFGRSGLAYVPAFGIRIDHAIIEGTVDLDGASIAVPVVFSNCKIVNCNADAALSLRDAEIRRLSLIDVTLETALVADRAIIENGFTAERVAAPAPLHLADARIGHALSLNAAMLGNGSQAVLAPGLRLNGVLTMNQATLTGTVAITGADIQGGIVAKSAAIGPSRAAGAAAKQGCSGLDLQGSAITRGLSLSHTAISGSLNLKGARVGGHLELDGATVTAVGTGVDMTDLGAGHSLHMDDARIAGAVRLSGATVAKHFNGRRLRVDGGETALDAGGLRVGGDFDMTAARLVGQLSFPGARIQGRMQLNQVKVYGSELALRGDGVRVRGEASLSRGFFVGAVRVPDGFFADRFSLEAATIKVESGPALVATDTRFDGHLELGAGLQTIGAVVLDRARVTGICNFAGGRLRSSAIARAAAGSNNAVSAGQDKRLDEAVLSLVDASFTRLQMAAQINDRPRGIVDLTRTSVAIYEDWSEAWPPPAAERTRDSSGRDLDHLVLDGFRYEQLINPAGAAERAPVHRDDRAGARRVVWIDGQRTDHQKMDGRKIDRQKIDRQRQANGAGRFTQQPWLQLERCLAAQGLKRDARRITIERRRRRRVCSGMTTPARWADRLLDWTTLYGFSPWRTVALMSAVVVVFTALWALAASHCTRTDCTDQTVFVMSKYDSYAPNGRKEHYPPFNALGYALDNFIPLGSIGYANHWRPNTRFAQLTEITVPHIPVFVAGETDKERIYVELIITVGGLLYLLTLVEQFLGIVCISLFVSNFAGLLRNEK